MLSSVSENLLTPREAAKLLNCTTRTIHNFITQGKISSTKEDGRYYIDKSEFFRAFPEAFNKDLESNPQFLKLEQERIKMENAMLKDSLSSRDKEIEFLREQVNLFNSKESQFLDAIQNHTKLLEHQSHRESGKKWTDIFNFKRK